MFYVNTQPLGLLYKQVTAVNCRTITLRFSPSAVCRHCNYQREPSNAHTVLSIHIVIDTCDKFIRIPFVNTISHLPSKFEWLAQSTRLFSWRGRSTARKSIFPDETSPCYSGHLYLNPIRKRRHEGHTRIR